jgi:UDP-N-acetyl-D-mannosaminuronate dehydrogenase
LEKSVDLSFYDPHVDELDFNKNSISKEKNLENLSSYDLILIHTPHSEFHEINFESVTSLIFDSTGSFEISDAERI